MGLLGDAMRDHHLTDPVPALALVVDVNDWLLETRTPYTLRMTLVIEAAGMPRATVEHTELVDASRGTHLDKWPDQGATIPVVVDRSDPTRVRIEWDRMQGKADRLRASAAEQNAVRKQQLLAEAYGTAPAAPSGASISVSPSARCPSCGAPAPSGDMFCRTCGARLH